MPFRIQEKMKPKIITVLVLTLTFTSLPNSQAAAKVFKNCTELNKIYAGGIAEKNTSTNKNKAGVPQESKNAPKVSSKVYKENKGLDRDKDGIACEI